MRSPLLAASLVSIFVGGVFAQAGESLENQDLTLADFAGRQLVRANLRGADLSSANFQGANLRGADFSLADLWRTDFRDADLRETTGWGTADFGDGIDARGANFTGADLREAKITGTYFEKADFSRADLRGATLAGRFHEATFDEALVEGTLFLGAGGIEPLHADLKARGAVVTADDFAAAVRRGRDFSNAELHGVHLMGVDLSGAKLRGANLHSANLEGATLSDTQLQAVLLYHGKAARARFDGANLSDAQMLHVDAAEANFNGANLQRADLSGANLKSATFRDADLKRADLSFADLTGADFAGAMLADVNVDGAILDNVRGLSPDQERALRGNARRWQHVLKMELEQFLQDHSLTVHLILTPLVLIAAATGWRLGISRAMFAACFVVNVIAFVPEIAGFVFMLLAGSPTAQLSSSPDLWSLWVTAWLFLQMALLPVGLAAITLSMAHLIQLIARPPRPNVLLSLLCILLTPANVAFAFFAFNRFAPTA